LSKINNEKPLMPMQNATGLHRIQATKVNDLLDELKTEAEETI
jgi:hypothetical protein